MVDFFERLPIEAATQMEQLSRLMYELRENRLLLLQPYAAADEAALLESIVAGGIPEHPAYEHYLGARCLEQTHAAIRAELKNLMAELGG